jgi:SagB-type dehydrogenase family enzyme
MRTVTTLRLRSDATLDLLPEDQEALLALGPRRIRLKADFPGILDALALLRDGAPEADLAAAASSHSGRQAVRSWARVCAALRADSWMEQGLRGADGPLVTLRPTSSMRGASGSWLGEETTVIMSRFAVMRREADNLLIESPRAGSLMIVDDLQVALLFAAMGTVARVVDLAKVLDTNLGAVEVRAIIRLLIEGRLALVAGQGELDARGTEETETSDRFELDSWSFPDLLFHARSRMGRHLNPYGGTYRFAGRHDPLPAAKPVAAAVVPLPQPDLEAVAHSDPSLTTVIEARASVRAHDDEHPITASQLGELLYRSQRLRWVQGTDGRGEVASRPYPGGGGLYELEVYPVIHQCAGLEPGLYRYVGDQHSLEEVAPSGDGTAQLLEMARQTSLLESTPQVLLVVTARFGRVMWKYESVPYSVILKNVGALYQTLYLVATAMGLAPCALGGGDSDIFAQLSGLRYEEESSVGEFVLGSRPSGWVRPTSDPTTGVA